jgi:glutaminyl-tRNA synthetase
MGTSESPAPAASNNFIRNIVAEDVAAGKHGGKVITRFPPEPNGYLHIGHAKSICLNFGTAREFGGHTNLRMDDTNPTKEEQVYIDSIQEDVRWLGFDWGEHEYHASDYFDQLYEWALLMIKAGKAFVCDLTGDQIREHRGTLKEPGKESLYRNRTPEENLDLFQRMRAGEFPDGARTLRAKIDMAAPNINLRDPVMYRVMHATHPRQGDKWCLYATYDWTHGQSDWIEGITHSICTLEFEDHRPLYDWYVDTLISLGAKPAGVDYRPHQYEFARLNMTHTMLSKRRLLQLVNENVVDGWDDPRMPTICGYRRRGYTPEAIRDFCERIGVAKADSMVDHALMEHCLRECLNKTAPRRMAVLDPIKVVLTNYPEGQEEMVEAVNNPENPDDGKRQVPFGRELYIEREDFREDPPKKFFRLAPGQEVRLRWAYFIRCQEVVKDAAGNVTELRCTYDPATHGGDAPDGRKVKGTIHWVSARHAIEAEVRLYEQLFSNPNPANYPEGEDWHVNLNPNSLTVLKTAKLEPSLADAKPGERVQFERHAYFCVDAKDSRPGHPVFNRTVGLKESWSKIEKKG